MRTAALQAEAAVPSQPISGSDDVSPTPRETPRCWAGCPPWVEALLQGLGEVADERVRRARRVDSEDLLLNFFTFVSSAEVADDKGPLASQREKGLGASAAANVAGNWGPETSAWAAQQRHTQEWLALVQALLRDKRRGERARGAEGEADKERAPISSPSVCAEELQLAQVGLVVSVQQRQVLLALLMLREGGAWVRACIAALEDLRELAEEEEGKRSRVPSQTKKEKSKSKRAKPEDAGLRLEKSAALLSDEYFAETFGPKSKPLHPSAGPARVFDNRRKEKRLWRGVAGLYLLSSVVASEFTAPVAKALSNCRAFLEALAPLLYLCCAKGGFLAVATLRTVIQVVACSGEHSGGLVEEYPETLLEILRMAHREQAVDPRGVSGAAFFALSPALAFVLQTPALRERMLSSERHLETLDFFLDVMLKAIADKHFCAIAVENASLARDTAVVFVELSADTQGCAAVKRRLAKWIRLWRDCRDLWGSRWSEGERRAWQTLSDSLLRRGEVLPTSALDSLCLWGVRPTAGGCAHCMRSENTRRFFFQYDCEAFASAAEEQHKTAAAAVAKEEAESVLGPTTTAETEAPVFLPEIEFRRKRELLIYRAALGRKEKATLFRSRLSERLRQRVERKGAALDAAGEEAANAQRRQTRDRSDRRAKNSPLVQDSSSENKAWALRASSAFLRLGVVCPWLKRALLWESEDGATAEGRDARFSQAFSAAARLAQQPSCAAGDAERVREDGFEESAQESSDLAAQTPVGPLASAEGHLGSDEEKRLKCSPLVVSCPPTALSPAEGTSPTESSNCSPTTASAASGDSGLDPESGEEVWVLPSIERLRASFEEREFSTFPCPQCGVVLYCSEECRRDDARLHSLLCSKTALHVFGVASK